MLRGEAAFNAYEKFVIAWTSVAEWQSQKCIHLSYHLT
jgi:hypothetical protein